jgi:arsenical pump membrane protein
VVRVRITASRLLLVLGVATATGAAIAKPGAARAAATQIWPAFVLVGGLLLIGLVAADDHLFSAAGQRLGAVAERSWVLYAGMCALVAAVTAVLNLDTAVAFLTPVAVYTSRTRGESPAILLAACLIISNAGSLLLPGSNLTNLIVLGHLHLSGSSFAARMGVPWLLSVLVSAGVLALIGRTRLRHRAVVDQRPEPVRIGLGLAGVAISVVLVLVDSSPALPVLAVGVLVAAARVAQRRLPARNAVAILGLPVLIGLFGLAVALGTLGRVWDGPLTLLRHLAPLPTAVVAAAATVVLNNLPAAALLSARAAPHPFSLLIGLDIGPNLFVTGSLAWVLWMASAQRAGERPPVRRTVIAGLVSAPLALLAAVGGLYLAGSLR